MEQALNSATSSIKMRFGDAGDTSVTADENFRATFGEAWEARPSKTQVHGIRIAQVVRVNQDCGEVDGIWTRVPGIALPILTADCAPILLAARDESWVGALHAGWRGTVAHIVREFFRVTGISPAETSAWIGPSIGPCCYEVSSQIIAHFRAEFPGAPVEPEPRRLDFKAALAHEFFALGLSPLHLDISSACTFCTPGFHSFRRDAGVQRQISAIARLPKLVGGE